MAQTSPEGSSDAADGRKRMTQSGEITLMLAAVRAGNTEAWQELANLIYADLGQLARNLLRRGRKEQTLDTGALVHECYLRLAQSDATPNDRAHFFALAARVMRQVMCDYARARLSDKRGNGAKALRLDDLTPDEEREAEQFVELDAALNDLAVRHERRARVVECRFFAGLSDQETADALGISVRSVAREWDAARKWLARDLARA
jgi:RNA polymerase sigma factor (TIGR02999 family)